MTLPAMEAEAAAQLEAAAAKAAVTCDAGMVRKGAPRGSPAGARTTQWTANVAKENEQEERNAGNVKEGGCDSTEGVMGDCGQVKIANLIGIVNPTVCKGMGQTEGRNAREMMEPELPKGPMNLTSNDTALRGERGP